MLSRRVRVSAVDDDVALAIIIDVPGSIIAGTPFTVPARVTSGGPTAISGGTCSLPTVIG